MAYPLLEYQGCGWLLTVLPAALLLIAIQLERPLLLAQVAAKPYLDKPCRATALNCGTARLPSTRIAFR
jgi:hypothetical protein